MVFETSRLSLATCGLVGVLFQTAPPATKPAGTPAATPAATAAARQASDTRRAIDALMECDDCRENQEQAVVRLGPAAVPILAGVLREGPSTAQRELVSQKLREAYQELKTYEKAHPASKVPMTEDEYVQTYLGNHVARYQVRAASMLGRLGGAGAKSALDEALGATLRDDVKTAVRAAIAQFGKR